MRLSVAATAPVQPRSANAAKLTLRIIESSLVKQCWTFRRRGDGGSEAGCAHLWGRGAQAGALAPESSAGLRLVGRCDDLPTSSRGSPPCFVHAPTRRQSPP